MAGTLGTPSVAAAETPATQVTQPQQNGPVVATHTLTLVTGEVVTLDRYASGLQAATIAPAPNGTAAAFSTIKVGDDVYVIPDEAQPYLAANELDRELFNVTKLVEYGYDDAHRPAVPLIATYAGAPGKAGKALKQAAPAGSVKADELPSANAVALRASKKKAATFWEAVDDDSAAAKTAPKLAGGIKKLWLDRPVKVALDQSVPQIGALEAWAKGYDGTGTKVAVLDTGLDPSHPDLAGRVKETRNFTADPDAVDHHGHGTHVASTVAGSGAASGGKYKGVAPGADLYIGKVLNNAGEGPQSGVIAGMEWAVAQGADVVSMSLGSEAPSDGTDPISEAVNQLTASSDTLFVIAAGNTGPGKQTIGSPGAADAALTVGAMSKQDQLAGFSSRGPRKDDFAVKPEITAPGVGIVAARAAGTSMGIPVDANYTSANGTSMATPHVSGAAAILAQLHPDWTADRLKQVLVGTAKQGSYTAYQQGSGRVDVPKAIDATVYSSPAVVSMGKSTAESAPVTKTITYVNTSAADTTLSLGLASSGETGPAPDGTFTLSATSVAVPANSTASVTVTYHPELGALGDYTGVITATATDGTAIHTTVGATKGVPTVDLTVDTIDRHGNPASGELAVFNLDTGAFQQVFPQGGTKTVAVPQGRYSVMGVVHTRHKAASSLVTDYTLAGEPVVELTADRTVTLDARLGKEVKVATPKESESKNGVKLGYRQQLPGKMGVDYMKGAFSPLWDRAYVVPTEPVTLGTFEFHFQQRRYSPEIRATYAGRGGALPLEPVVYAARLYGRSTLQAVDAGMARPEDLTGKDLSGKLAVVTRDATRRSADQITAVAGAGAKAVIIVNDRPGPFATIVPRSTGTAIPAWSLTQEEGAVLFGRMADGPTRISLKGITNVPQVYNIAMMVPGGIPADPVDAVTAENSAVVKSHYRSTKGTVIGDVVSAIRPNDSLVTDVYDSFDVPVDREEWYSTGSKSPMMKEIRWWHRIYPDRADNARSVRDVLRTYQPGEQHEETWLGAANGPAGPEASQAVREGDNITLTVPEMSDSQGHHGFFEHDADKRTVRLYQDGKLLKEVPRLWLTTLPVSPDPATYRLTLDTQRPAWFPLSTQTSTAWTFKSARPASGKENLALLWPRYGFDLDAENSARGGKIDHFDLTFALQTGATPNIRGVEVTVSTDDGATWHSATTKSKQAGTYKVTVRNPASGYVSLRVKAWDANGSEIEQTLIRAYAVR